jgi:hypothetical protein
MWHEISNSNNRYLQALLSLKVEMLKFIRKPPSQVGFPPGETLELNTLLHQRLTVPHKRPMELQPKHKGKDSNKQADMANPEVTPDTITTTTLYR